MRHAKQLIYGVMYLIFWVALGTGIYFHYIKPAPSCFDNLKNQNEEGVDCGGVCSRLCMPDLQPLTVGDTQFFPLDIPGATSTQRVSLIGEIRNPNEIWAAAGFNYVFKVLDADGNTLGTFSGNSYVHAGEVKYLALPNVALDSARLPQRAVLTITDPSWKRAVDFLKPDISLTLQTTDTSPILAARGVIVNRNAVPVTAELTAIFKDTAGNPAGVSATSLEHLAPGETREFSIFHPALQNIDPARTKVFTSGYITK